MVFGKAIVDGATRLVTSRNVITMPAGCRHTMIAREEGLQLFEL